MWIEITDAKNVKRLINIDKVMDIHYSQETDLTVVEFSRGAYPAVYIRGNKLIDFRRIIDTHDMFVCKIGD